MCDLGKNHATLSVFTGGSFLQQLIELIQKYGVDDDVNKQINIIGSMVKS